MESEMRDGRASIVAGKERKRGGRGGGGRLQPEDRWRNVILIEIQTRERRERGGEHLGGR